MKKYLRKWTFALRKRRHKRELKKKQVGLLRLKKISESDQTCQNCGSNLSGPFCHACGQKDNELRRPIWSFAREIVDEVFSSDSRLAKTLVLLMLMPGGLTRYYVSGKRARYVPPVRLYLIVSIIFFAVLSISDVAIINIAVTKKSSSIPVVQSEEVKGEENQIEKPDVEKLAAPKAELTTEQKQELEKRRQEVQEALDKLSPEGKEALKQFTGDDPVGALLEAEEGGKKINVPDYDVSFQMFVPAGEQHQDMITDAEFDKMLTGDIPEFLRNIANGFKKTLKNPRLLNEGFNKWLPRALFVLLPIFALMVRSMHWGKQRYYYNQLVFSLHFHTFLFVLMIGLIWIVPIFGTDVGANIFALGSFAYLLIALKVAQNQGWIRAFLKWLVLAVNYLVILILTVIGIVLLSLGEI